MKRVEICDRGAVDTQGRPVVDVYLIDGATAKECWMWATDISVPQAKKIVKWFKSIGVKTVVEEASSEPALQRSLFDA
jgi:hypothetical protein